MTIAIEWRREVRSRRPADWGRYPSLSIAFCTRFRVFSPTDDDLPLMTLDTVASDTSAAAATSLIVGRNRVSLEGEDLGFCITFYLTETLD